MIEMFPIKKFLLFTFDLFVLRASIDDVEREVHRNHHHHHRSSSISNHDRFHSPRSANLARREMFEIDSFSSMVLNVNYADVFVHY